MKPKYRIKQGDRRAYEWDVLIRLDGILIFRGSFTSDRISEKDKKLLAAFESAVEALNEQEAG